MVFKDDDLQEILTIFKSESEEHLQKLNDGILALEQDPSKRDLIEEIFREAHSLKGAARMIGFEEIEKVAHRMEDIFNDARKGKISLVSPVTDYLLEGLDLINKVVNVRLRGRGGAAVSLGDYLQRQPVSSGVGAAEPVGMGTDFRVEAYPEPPAERLEPRRQPLETTTSPDEKDSKVQPQPEPGEADLVPMSAPESPSPLGDGISVSLGVREEISRGIRQVEEKIKIRKRQNEMGAGGSQYEETIRVSVDKLDELMAQVGEVLVVKIRSDQHLAELRDFLGQFARFQRNWHRQVRRGSRRVTAVEDRQRSLAEFVAANARTIEELNDQMVRLADGLSDENLRLDLISTNLQEGVNRIRMLPLAALFNFFPRLVRDIAREQDKEVELVLRGAETKLDKRILEELKDPLTHLLRNSIDHGLESPDERMAAGKPAIGRLTLSAYQKGNSVLVELEDDGRGIDPDAIREVAIRRNFMSPDALAEMTPAQLIQIIFQPGFTTKTGATDMSGRGVGLDVVLTNIERLKGKINTLSSPGRGTKFSIKLPLTLATTQALLIRCQGQRYAIPLTAVESTGEIELDDVSLVEGRETVQINQQILSLVRLSEVLGLPDASQERQAMLSVMVLSAVEEKVAFLVDDFIGEREVVVKNLGTHLTRVPNVAGATILADGTPVMILNVFDLIKNAPRTPGKWIWERMVSAAVIPEKRIIMVVDDSITTRTLEKNILESNGFTVISAINGADALEKLHAAAVDLVISDIQMPRMDGFSLIEAIRRDAALANLPVILVTSLDSEEDKLRGFEVGATAYFAKGAFDQKRFLETIRSYL